MESNTNHENRLVDNNVRYPVANQKPWYFIHSMEEWDSYKQKIVPPDIKWCNNHDPEEPRNLPCLVETDVIEWTCHHRFVYVDDAYRLLFSMPQVVQPRWIPS